MPIFRFLLLLKRSSLFGCKTTFAVGCRNRFGQRCGSNDSRTFGKYFNPEKDFGFRPEKIVRIRKCRFGFGCKGKQLNLL